MTENIQHIEFTTKVQPIQKLTNPEFTLVKLFVMCHGKNQNYSNIPKTSVENAIPTLPLCPIVAYIFKDEDGSLKMGGHESVLERDSETNQLYLKSKTQAYGVLLENCEPAWEIVEENGVEKEYLSAKGVLWTGRNSELAELMDREDGFYTKMSMEISVHEASKNLQDPRYTDLTKFNFSAMCMLGDDVEPCFPSAEVRKIEFQFSDELRTEFAKMKDELQKLNLNFDKKENTLDEGKGGKNLEDKEKKDETFESEEAVITEPVTEDTLVEKPNEAFNEGSEGTNDADDTKPDGENADATDGSDSVKEFSFAATYKAKHEALWKALDALYASDSEMYLYYNLMDFTDEYVMVGKTLYNEANPNGEYTYGRFEYSMADENKAVISEESYIQMFIEWITGEEKAAIETARTSLEDELAGLKAYKAEKEVAEKQAEFESILNQFEDLSDMDEFEKIKENAMNYESKDALERECFALLGQKVASKKEGIKIPILNDVIKEKTSRKELHEEFMAQYKNK